MPGIFPFRTLNSTLSRDIASDPDDVQDVKSYLHQRNFYEPGGNITPVPDDRLFNSISDYQRNEGIQIDGVMKPDGETQNRMRFHEEMAASPRFPAPPVLQEKVEFFKKEGLEKKRKEFNTALNMQDRMSEAQHKSFITTYDMEGGEAETPGGSAVAGITQRTLDELIDKKYLKNVQKGTKPNQLSSAQIAQAYGAIADYSLERVGGRTYLDSLPNADDARLVFDMVVRHGPSGGAALIKAALNEIRQNDEDELDMGEGRLGPQTAAQLEKILKDVKRQQELRKRVAEKRLREYPEDAPRFRFFTKQ